MAASGGCTRWLVPRPLHIDVLAAGRGSAGGVSGHRQLLSCPLSIATSQQGRLKCGPVTGPEVEMMVAEFRWVG